MCSNTCDTSCSKILLVYTSCNPSSYSLRRRRIPPPPTASILVRLPPNYSPVSYQRSRITSRSSIICSIGKNETRTNWRVKHWSSVKRVTIFNRLSTPAPSCCFCDCWRNWSSSQFWFNRLAAGWTHQSAECRHCLVLFAGRISSGG